MSIGCTVNFVARCFVCQGEFNPKQLHTIAFETNVCGHCLRRQWQGCEQAKTLASEIGKIASAAYHTAAEREEVLEACVDLSNQIQKVCGTPEAK